MRPPWLKSGAAGPTSARRCCRRRWRASWPLRWTRRHRFDGVASRCSTVAAPPRAASKIAQLGARLVVRFTGSRKHKTRPSPHPRTGALATISRMLQTAFHNANSATHPAGENLVDAAEKRAEKATRRAPYFRELGISQHRLSLKNLDSSDLNAFCAFNFFKIVRSLQVQPELW